MTIFSSSIIKSQVHKVSELASKFFFVLKFSKLENCSAIGMYNTAIEQYCSMEMFWKI